jgi:uncharacterized protein
MFIIEFCEKLRLFISNVCKDRPDHHGVQHMDKVMQLSLTIASLNCVNDYRKLFDICCVAMLHDVSDHKYDKDGVLNAQIKDFLINFYNSHSIDIVMDTINAVSFSKEKKLGKRYFEIMLGAYWTEIRDIVSDADKIEAMGIEGIKRCYQYSRDSQFCDNSETVIPEIIRNIQDHAEEKLLRLYDEYIVTPGGKYLAESHHKKSIEILEKWKINPPTSETEIYEDLV